MKIQLVLFLFCWYLHNDFIFAQQQVSVSELPEPVLRYFPVVYKVEDMQSVRWSQKDSIFIAHFVSNGVPVEVHMKSNGFWLRTYWEIDCNGIPDVVKRKCLEGRQLKTLQKCYVSNNAFNEYQYHYYVRQSTKEQEYILKDCSVK